MMTPVHLLVLGLWLPIAHAVRRKQRRDAIAHRDHVDSRRLVVWMGRFQARLADRVRAGAGVCHGRGFTALAIRCPEALRHNGRVSER
jgi:hypothetical protein